MHQKLEFSAESSYVFLTFKEIMSLVTRNAVSEVSNTHVQTPRNTHAQTVGRVR